MKKAPHVQRKRVLSGSAGIRMAAGVASLVVIGLAVFISRGIGPDQARPADATSRPAARTVSLAVRGVASKFICGCGECNDLELADCTCPRAVEERELIDQELKRKTPEREVVRLVNSRYGHIKPQYASLVAGASN